MFLKRAAAALMTITAQVAHAGQIDLTDLSLEQLLEVKISSASKYEQKANEAPADVSVVSYDDIHRYGWRNLSDVLRSVRSFYLNNDRTYQYVGIRGVSPPGDLNNRILFMIDGVRVNDNVFDSVMMGETFPLDLDLVDHIEIIRGPGSSMYGGNAMFGVINVITRSGHNIDGTELGGGAASHRTYDGRVSAGEAVGNKEWLVSASKGYSGGGSYEFADIAPGVKTLNQADAENWQRLFGKISVNDWHASLVYGERQKYVPTGSYGTIFNDPNHHEDDTFLIADINKLLQIDDKQEAYVRMFSGQYKYLGQWPYDNSAVPGDGRPYVLGDANVLGRWQGLEGRWTSSLWSNQQWITGLEYSHNQSNYDYVETPPFAPNNMHFQGSMGRVGLYTQDEITVADKNHLTIGIRHDQTSGYVGNWSPRLAFVRQPDQANTYKILYGTAFRDPDFFANLSTNHNPLKPERIQTLEGLWQHRFGANTSLMANLFENQIHDVIQQNSSYVYFNASTIITRGTEFELESRLNNDVQIRASYTLQRTSQDGVVPDNSPMQIFKTNISLPVAPNWTTGLEVQGTSGRQTNSGMASVDSFAIANLTLGYHTPDNKWQVKGSIYNLFNRQYLDPTSVDGAIQSYYGVTRSSLAEDDRLFWLRIETRF